MGKRALSGHRFGMPATVPAFEQHLAASHRAPRTIQTYTAVIASLTHTLTASNVLTDPPTRHDIEVFLARPRLDGEPRSAAARNQELAALKVFTRFAQREGEWATDPTAGIAFCREPPHDPAVLTAPELAALFRVAASKSRPRERARNLALLAVLSQAGLRVHELVGLDVAQVDLGTGTLVAVKGKGNTVHDIPLNTPAVALLTAWLTEREARARTGVTALFVSDRGTRLAIRTVERLVETLRAKMGTPKHVTPHTLRHSFATLQLLGGTDLATVAETLRHTDLNVTRRYLHLIDTRRRESVRRLAITVPVDVLPTAPTPSPPAITMASPLASPEVRKVTLPATPEAPGSPPPIPLDHQHGLVDIAA